MTAVLTTGATLLGIWHQNDDPAKQKKDAIMNAAGFVLTAIVTTAAVCTRPAFTTEHLMELWWMGSGVALVDSVFQSDFFNDFRAIGTNGVLRGANIGFSAVVVFGSSTIAGRLMGLTPLVFPIAFTIRKQLIGDNQ